MKSILLLILVICVSTVAYAGLVFEFSGYIEQVNENTNNAISDAAINQPFSGWFSYSNVPDQSPIEGNGVYDQNASISVTLGSKTYTCIDQYSFISVSSDGTTEDYFSFSLDGLDQTRKYVFNSFGVNLHSNDLTSFSDDSLLQSLETSDFDYMGFYLRGRRWSSHTYTYADSFNITGVITNISTVPEPASLMLLGFGGLALIRKNRA